jgi:hypothetical protein
MSDARAPLHAARRNNASRQAHRGVWLVLRPLVALEFRASHRATPSHHACQPHLQLQPSGGDGGKAEEQTAKPLISARMAHSKSSPSVVTTREELAGRSGATLTCGTTAHGTHRSRWVRRVLVCCAAASDVQDMRRACGLPKPEVRLKHCCCGVRRERDG